MIKERQYGGFAVYVSVTIILTFIVIWALFPQTLIHGHVIEEFYDLLPQRYWIIAVQCFILMLMLFTYIGLLTYNVDVLTVELNDLRTITDGRGRTLDYKDESELEYYFNHETSGVIDLPINEVSRALYLYDK